MKIVYVVDGFPIISQTFILNEITALMDKGYDVHIISIKTPKYAHVHNDVVEYQLQERTVYINTPDHQRKFKLDSPLKKTMEHCMLIHAHFAAWSARYAYTLSKLTEIPYTFTAHAYDIFRNPDVEEFTRLVQNARNVVTVSQFNKSYIKKLTKGRYEEKINIIRCGINLDRFKPSKLNNNESGVVSLLTVGRFVEKKGIMYSLMAFSELCKKYSKIQYRIIGDGPMRGDIERFIENNNLNKNVTLLGYKNDMEVISEMNRADMYVLTSVTGSDGDKEGIPVSILEAQAMQLPVLSSVHSGIPEAVLEGRTGFLVPEKNVGEIYNKMEILVGNADLRERMGKQGREYMKKHFNHRIEIDKLSNLIHNSVNEKYISNKLNRLRQRYYRLHFKSTTYPKSIMIRGIRYLKREGIISFTMKVMRLLLIRK